jgi:hypothetical protein
MLGFKGHGVARVRVEYVGPAPIQGTDDRILAATLREGAPAPAPSGVMIASNRFLPDFGRRPSSMQSGVPLPQDRPYDLGERDGRVASAYPQMRTADADATTLANEALARHRYGPRVADVSPDTDPAPYMARGRVVERKFVQPVEDAEVRAPFRESFAPQPPAVSPVTAYAQDPIRSIITGRGLY